MSNLTQSCISWLAFIPGGSFICDKVDATAEGRVVCTLLRGNLSDDDRLIFDSVAMDQAERKGLNLLNLL